MRPMLLATLLLVDCRGAPASRPSTDSSQFLRAFGECAMAHNAIFQRSAEALAAATAKLDADPSVANVEQARIAWTTAIDAWEQLIPMKIGPLSAAALPGGLGLDDGIYAWSLVNRCRIDELTLDRSYATIATALPDRRGLAALEYLLFYEGADNGCDGSHPMNATGTWATVDAAELRARKRGYAKAIAADVVASMRRAIDAWDPAKGNFLGALVSAGRGSTLYKSDGAGVNAVSDAMFVVDSDTKDKKLVSPESKYAKRGKEHIRNNLVGFRKLFTGCGDNFSGVGFDDLLTARGAAALGAAIDADIAAAIASVDALPGTLEDAMTKDPAAVRRIYDAIKEMTDALKTEFVSVLNLELPKQVAGDAD